MGRTTYLYISKVKMSDLFRALKTFVKTIKMFANMKYAVQYNMRATVSFRNEPRGYTVRTYSCIFS